MRVLVFVEPHRGSLPPGGLGLLTRARQLTHDVDAVLCGADVSELATTLGQYGARRVYLADRPDLAHPLAEARTSLVAALLIRTDARLVLFENSSLTAEIAGRLAARLEIGVNWDLSDLEIANDPVGTRLATGDAVSVSVAWTTPRAIGVFRRGSLETARPREGAPAEVLTVDHELSQERIVVLSSSGDARTESSLDSTEVVVSGGRGLRAPEDLRLLESLAETLHGAVAVSMPLVDRGWYPHSRQIGQTGKTVRPRVYIACGISGAIAHRVGMDNSGAVIAINSDPSAPIFAFCDLGVVGDLYDVVPELNRLLQGRGASDGDVECSEAYCDRGAQRGTER